METKLEDVKFLRKGKVRDIYEYEDYFFIVASDRVSVFDRVLPDGRSMLVKKAKPLPVEYIVRGYLSGSGWKEYKKRCTVCGKFIFHDILLCFY